MLNITNCRATPSKHQSSNLKPDVAPQPISASAGCLRVFRSGYGPDRSRSMPSRNREWSSGGCQTVPV